MTRKLSTLALASFALAGGLGLSNIAAAQVAGGTTTANISITESTQVAMG